MKSPTPEPADARTIREYRMSPRLRLVIAGSITLVFIVAALLAVQDNESPELLTRSDIEEMVRRMMVGQNDGLRDELKVLSGRIAQLTTKLTGQYDALEVLQGQFAGMETDVAALKSVDWTQGLQSAKESWRIKHKMILERMDAIEKKLKRNAAVRGNVKASTRKAEITSPSFRISAIEYWGDTSYAMLSSGGHLTLLREGDVHQGWQFVGVDADGQSTIFANQKQTRTLRVGR